jgi:hypothetical protein
MLKFCEASTFNNRVKTMVNRLFESFLDSEDQYRACERYWERLVCDIAASLGQVGEWPRWMPRQYADGTAMELDGNPIFDGRSKRLERAFTIIQHRAMGDEVEIAGWLKTYEPEYSDLPRHELVLNLSLSEESAALARKLIWKWMSPATTADEMVEFVRNNVPQSEQPGGE